MCNRVLFLSCFLFSTLVVAIPGNAAISVWVEFDDEWTTGLATATSGLVAPALEPSDVMSIESDIITELERIYEDYEIAFVPSATAPIDYDMRIDFGATTDDGLLGKAPILFGLQQTHVQRDGTAPGDAPHKANIFTEEFDLYIDAGESRATQIAELTAALGRIGGHELGHSLGLLHHHVYGNAGIGPDNYSDTGGLQNSALMATGTSIAGGVDGFETVTELPAELGKWERALLDTTGGSLINFAPPVGVGMGATVVTSPVISECESGTCDMPMDLVDIGETIPTAQLLTPSIGETSGLMMWYVTGFNHELPGGDPDIDLYAIEIPSEGLLTVDLWSEHAFGGFFNTEITLLDPYGLPIFMNDDATYKDDAFDLGAEGPPPGGPFGVENSFIANLPIPEAGTFFLKVNQVGLDPAFHPYALIAGFEPIPEPTSLALVASTAICLLMIRRRL